MIIHERVKVKSFDGHILNVSLYRGNSRKVKGVVQITHGMYEHSGNHTSLIKYLVSNSYIVAIYDHRGHGRYNRTRKEFSFTCTHNNFDLMVEDLRSVNSFLKNEYKNLKIFLLGYSMGGYLSLRYSQLYGDTIDGLVLVGIGKEKEMITLGSLVSVKFIGLFKKPEYLSEFVKKRVNSKICKKSKTYKGNRNTICQNRFSKDRYRIRTYTLKFYHDLFEGIHNTLKSESFKSICKDLKVYIIGGDSDAICSFGSGIIRLDKELTTNGISCKYKIYDGISHNLFIENRKEVNGDIVDFLNSFIL